MRICDRERYVLTTHEINYDTVSKLTSNEIALSGCQLKTYQDASGTYQTSTAAAPSTPITLLSAAHDFGAFVAAALEHAPQGLDAPPVLAASATATFPDICAALSKRLGVEVRYRQSNPGEMEAAYGDFGRHFANMYEFYNEFGFAGDEPVREAAEVSNIYERLLNWI